LGGIGEWNTGNVRNMEGMFHSSRFNHDISRWDTGNVRDMSMMFYGSLFNGDIGSWNIGSLEKVESIFNNSHYCRNLYNWNLQRPDLDLSLYIRPELLEYKFNERWIDYGKT
jgi:surface protein